MHFESHFLLLLACCTTALCELLGPKYPAPKKLSSQGSLVSKSWENLTSTFRTYLEGSAALPPPFLPGAKNVSLSLGLFSVDDAAASHLQYHYTSPEVAAAANGTNKIDGNSIYRVASVSKLITTFAGMRELSGEDWHRPLTSIIPGLVEYARKASRNRNSVYDVNWEEITPWTLASQESGLPQDGAPINDDLVAGIKLAEEYGFPPVDPSGFGPCWNVSLPQLDCSSRDFVESVRWEPPNVLPWTTPLYSDENFMILGIALSALKKKSMPTIYQEAIFDALGMSSSYFTPPVQNPNSVMADATAAGFATNIPYTTPSGGLFSTINDLTKFGIAILNSTLLPAETTRRWMKPLSHTASLTYSVGAPWEIVRYISPLSDKVTDIYTKLGDSGDYGGIVALIPDYNAGFTMLNTGSNVSVRSNTAMVVLDLVTAAVLPALEIQAAAEATQNFVGIYISQKADFNSSITISFNKTTGLLLSNWISNGTDMIQSPVTFGGEIPTLQMSINSKAVGRSGQVAFRASKWASTDSYLSPDAAKLGATGPFTGEYYSNFEWWTVSQSQYAGVGTDLFVFDVDECGKATSVTAASTRAKLVRKA